MSKSDTVNDVQPKSVMSESELAAWAELSPTEQLARLRAAIDKGVKSGSSGKTMDDVWNEALRRQKNARL